MIIRIALWSPKIRMMTLEMSPMIKDGRIVVELPEDWKKIIATLREGPGRIEDIASRSGVKVWKARKIVGGMKLLGIVRINGTAIALRERK